ncbi:MAG: cupin domain-containing protein [Anaerolineales bacterium]|nr:cupin domain-containing protein [Anaerolineales bacterium]
MERSIAVNRSVVKASSIREGVIGRDVVVLQETENLVSGVTIVHPQCQTSGHAHPHREEHYFVLRGSGYIQLDEDTHPIHAGDCIYVPPISMHTVVNTEQDPLEFYWTAFPDEPKITG